MTESEKIEFTAGRVHALVGFVTAIILSHPNPACLAHSLEEVGLANLATAEASASDRYVEGVQDMQQRIRKAVEIALCAC